MKRLTVNSKLSVAIVFVSILLALFQTTWSVLTWDAFGYYLYLPMAFLEHSLGLPSLDYPNALFDQYAPSSTLYQFTQVSNGSFIIRYPVGMAMVYAPFFGLGHVSAFLVGCPTDGFSAPYQIAMKLGSAFYYVLGFVFLRKILIKYFSDRTVTVALLLLFFGSNLLQFLPMNHVMANGTSFFLFSLLLFITDRYFLEPHTKLAFALGFVFGLICLTRFTNALIIIPVLLWPVITHGNQGFKKIRGLFKSRNKDVLIASAMAIGLFSLQLIYWKIAGGEWFLDSYGTPGEGLDLHAPHLVNFLFSFRTGWFIYTPMMMLVLVFLFWSVLNGNINHGPILFFILLFVYVASSWSNYSYGGGFSQRAMVEAMAILVFPMAHVVQSLASTKSRGLKIMGQTVLGLGLLLNAWNVVQFQNKVISYDRNTKAYYLASFFDFKPEPNKQHLLSVDRNLDVDSTRHIPAGYHKIKSYALPLVDGVSSMEGIDFTPAWRMPFDELCPEDHCWLSIEIETLGNTTKDAVIVMTFEREEGLYHYRAYEINKLLIKKDSLHYNGLQIYLTPEVRSPKDKFTTYIWNRSLENLVPLNAHLSVYVKTK